MEQYHRGQGADVLADQIDGEGARLLLNDRQLLRWFPHSVQVWGSRALLDSFAAQRDQGCCRICAQSGHPEARCALRLACECEALRDQGADEYPPGTYLLTLGLGVSEEQALALLRGCGTPTLPERAYRVPPYEAHTIRARSIERGRALLLAPVRVLPGEEAPCNLPHAGYRSSDYLRLALAGEIDAQAGGAVSRTGAALTIYHGVWAMTGHNAGYWWREWVEIEGMERERM